MARRVFGVWIALLLVILCTASCKDRSPSGAGQASARGAPLRVAAAADLTAAFQELGPAFTRATGHTPEFTFGSSGLLSRQLAEGAPFDFFASASPDYADRAAASGRCDATSKMEYAQGRLALFVPRTSQAVPATTLSSLADPSYARIAIANPEHAPYGVAAREALTNVGILEAVTPRLVFGENVRATLQLAESGNVEAALVAFPLVRGRQDGAVQLLDAGMHTPLRQTGLVCTGGRNVAGARAFATYLRGPDGQAILQRFGFDPAGAR